MKQKEIILNELPSDLIPTSWLDSILTGEDAVIDEQPYDSYDIENLLKAIKKRMVDFENKYSIKKAAKNGN